MLQFNRRVLVDGTGAVWAARGRAGPAVFERAVCEILLRIDDSETGSRLLAFLDRQKHDVTIRVPTADDRGERFSGAQASPLDSEGAFPKGDRLRQGDGSLFGKTRGTGKGSAVEIPFDASLSSFNASGHPDHVLIHELTHAARSVSGTLRNIAMKGFDTRDEFYGICVENMYASERGWKMRTGHDGKSWVTSVNWSMMSPAFSPAMAALHKDCADLMVELARAPTSFNPFKQWLLASCFTAWAGGGSTMAPE